MIRKGFLFLIIILIGNIVSILNKWNKNNLRFILEPRNGPFNEENLHLIFNISEILERLPNKIPFRFNCYEKALTGRLLLNFIKIPNKMVIGVNPFKNSKYDKFHAWLSTESCDVCGFSIKENYVVFTVYS